MRREYEQEQSRTRIDDLLKNNANIREELATTKTQRDQLQARMEEIKVELRAAEEKAQALYPRLTSGPRTATSDNLEDQENQLTPEQELNVQILGDRKPCCFSIVTLLLRSIRSQAKYGFISVCKCDTINHRPT